jgi:hypothetical protein
MVRGWFRQTPSPHPLEAHTPCGPAAGNLSCDTRSHCKRILHCANLGHQLRGARRRTARISNPESAPTDTAANIGFVVGGRPRHIRLSNPGLSLSFHPARPRVLDATLRPTWWMAEPTIGSNFGSPTDDNTMQIRKAIDSGTRSIWSSGALDILSLKSPTAQYRIPSHPFRGSLSSPTSNAHRPPQVQ